MFLLPVQLFCTGKYVSAILNQNLQGRDLLNPSCDINSHPYKYVVTDK
jgi:hypothetical protein